MFTVDAALERTCADFRDQVARGEITAGERDLLTDGAILLAVYLEELIQDARAGEPQGRDAAEPAVDPWGPGPRSAR